jgi:hypothetical protein
MDTLKLKPPIYWYHWTIIRRQNKEICHKLTEENIREELDRTINGLEAKIQQLEPIINDPKTSTKDKIKVIRKQVQLIIDIPWVMINRDSK